MNVTIAQKDKYTKICLCGYETDSDAFKACTAQGTEVDAEEEPGFKKCPQCGRVFSADTGEYVEERLEKPTTEMERKAILLKGIWETELESWGQRFLNRYLCRITALALGRLTEKELEQIVHRGLADVFQNDKRLNQKVLDIVAGLAEFILCRTLVERYWTAAHQQASGK